jgi:calcium-dependent protein kinase
MGIVHRDLKPENILIETSPDMSSNEFFIKLIDFGTSKPFKPNQTLKEKTGTVINWFI